MACSDCFRGGITTNEPTGTETIIHGLSTYVAQPVAGVVPKGLVVIITDAFGWSFVNNRVLCDRYAKRGNFLVYCPDFMNGNAMDPSAIPLMDKIMEPASWFTTIFYKPIYIFQTLAIGIPWKKKTAIPVTHPQVLAFFQALRTSPPPFQTPNLRIGAAGFCWGGKHAFLLAQDNPPSRVERHESQAKSGEAEPMSLVDCVFTAHPSYIELPNDVEAINIPLSVAIGDVDMGMKIDKVEQMKEILIGKTKEHEVVVMKGAKHGFAIRTHPDDEAEMECAEKAEKQAVEWFNKWFS